MDVAREILDTAVAIIMQVNSYLYIWRVELCINLEMYRQPSLISLLGII